jgi:hypothetical protein
MQPEDDDKPDVDPADDDNKSDPALDDKPDDGDKPGDKPDLGDPGKKAIEAMKRERNAARKQLADLQAELKKYSDRDKTDTERLTEAAEEAKSRAAKAETDFRKLTTAMDRAPEGATLTQIRAVAKRLSGDTDEDMEADADELFGLFAPKSTTEENGRPAPNGKPTTALKGGGSPDEEPEEMDPSKLADLIGRS